jgi:GAF domain-containing protein
VDPPVNRAARLDRLASHFSTIDSQRQIIELAAAEVRNTLGYRTTWLGVWVRETDEFRALMAELSGGEDLWDSAIPLPVTGDHYVSRIVETGEVQVVIDAQVDPHVNHEIVAQLGNRTIINVPIDVDGERFGSLGTGTFGDEGPRPPSDEDLRYLEQIGAIMGVAMSRVLRLAGHIA